MMKRVLTLLVAGVLALPLAAEAQKTIKVGMPIPLSGPPALFGEPASKGAQMFVDELNAKGGVLGRKIELVIRDSKADANEAVRVARELILKDNVDFLVGTLTSAEGPAVSVVAKENKIVFIAPIPKTDQLTAPDKLHPYVFRVASNTTIEGRSAAEVSVPTRKSTFSFRISSRATRTASFASALESRMTSSILRPRTPPLALSSSTNICAPFDAGSPNSAGGPDSGMGMPTLIGFCASAAMGRARSAASASVSRRIMTSLLWL